MGGYNKKILIACDSSQTLIGFRGKLIAELTKTIEVHVFTPRISDAYTAQILKNLNVTVHENELMGSNVSILSDIRYMIALYRLINQIKPDIFFPYTFKPVIYGSVIAKICKVDRITPMLTGLGYNFTAQGKKNKIVNKITKMLLKFSLINNQRLRIIFQNRDDYTTLLTSGIISSNHKTSVVNGSGVDLTYYRFSLPNTKKITFLMIARLINAKGIENYFEAAKLVKIKFPDARFSLIGPYDDNIDAISAALYHELKSGSVIEYLGEVKDVRPYIQSASVMVLPSYYGEGIPRCLLEGMAIGRPIITCDSVGCRETVLSAQDTRNGHLIPVKDVYALAGSMLHYLSHKEDITNNGVNGRRYAEQKFDVNLVNAAMLDIMCN